jgi:hypothetical protein
MTADALKYAALTESTAVKDAAGCGVFFGACTPYAPTHKGRMKGGKGGGGRGRTADTHSLGKEGRAGGVALSKELSALI